ncbi:response regulator, partial [Balneolaceae bacterium ANBcel3]|nr:response regulator [Balneolaceae bacterium ANBcel3]
SRPDKSLLKEHISADFTKIQQILVNLFRNAVKFTDKGSIEVGVYTLKPGEITFYVKDTGIGIPKEKQGVIFDFFRQVEEGNTRRFSGLGIGLAISKKITDVLQGRLHVESEAGQGSTFYLSVPVEFIGLKRDLCTDPKKSANIQKVKSKTVLVVEDYENARTLVRFALEEFNIRILEAINGKEAVALVEKHPEIDLVLMDLKMPVMDGYEATRIIKGIRPELCVISLTAYAGEMDQKEAFVAGCDDIILKPFSIEDLRHRVVTTLKQRTAAS